MKGRVTDLKGSLNRVKIPDVSGLAKSRLFVQKATQAVKTGKNQFLPVFTAKFAFAAKIARNWFKRYSGPYSVV